VICQTFDISISNLSVFHIALTRIERGDDFSQPMSPFITGKRPAAVAKSCESRRREETAYGRW
jgi:hypothetical protein